LLFRGRDLENNQEQPDIKKPSVLSKKAKFPIYPYFQKKAAEKTAEKIKSHTPKVLVSDML
jgi:hypothetical protein